MTNASSWQDLTRKYPTFVYENFSYLLVENNLTLRFTFSIAPDFIFTPVVVIKNVPLERYNQLSKVTIDTFVFHVGLIEALSYWKLTASKTIEIHCGTLSTDQITWYKNLLIQGMGEYIYKNGIDIAYIEGISLLVDNTKSSKPFDQVLKNRALIPLGGGKDSLVTTMLVKDLKEANAFLLNPTAASISITESVGWQKPIIVERMLDSQIYALNQKGFLNGHTPFSALLAVLGVFSAVLFDYREVVLSNERSSNEGNVMYQDHMMNHQYSKTYGFEKGFSQYVTKYLATQVAYFSFLRPLYEIQIAHLFSKYSQYFSQFKSCNVGQKQNAWCGNCAKCLFVYASLYPFIGYDAIIAIFKKDLFTDSSLLPMLKELLGLAEHKPFECVGTYDETRAALYLSLKTKRDNQVLLSYFATQVLPKHTMQEHEAQTLLTAWNVEHILPKEYEKLLKEHR